jgi:hypothetical protein
MIVARTLASAARSCIQRCRQSRGGELHCSCSARAGTGEVIAGTSRPEPAVGIFEVTVVKRPCRHTRRHGIPEP